MIRKSNAFYGMNSRLSVFFKATLWLGLFTPVTLFAQQDAAKAKKADSIDKVNQLKEVQIRTLKISRRQTSSTPLQILSGEELQKLNSLSVADAVRFFSGVQLKDYGGIGGLKTINVRSMGTNHTAVFYDGVQIGNAQNGQVDLGKFSLDNIEEIELYNGQKSSIFQSAKGFASGSSLYLKSKQPDFSDGRTQKVRAALKGGSFGLVNPSLLWQSKISNSIYSSLSAEYKNAHGRYKFRSTNGVYDTTAVRTDGDIEAMRLELGLNGILPDSSKWRVKLYGYKDKQGLPGAIVNNVFSFPQRMWNRNAFVQSSYEKNTGKYSLLATVKYANDYQHYLNPERITTNGFEENKYHQQEVYLSFVNKLEMTKYWDIVLSADYQWNKLDADLYRFAYPIRNTVLTALATQFKLDRFDIQANLLSTLKYDQTREGPGDPDRKELTPTVMVSWQPFNQKEFRVRSFYKSIFRMPTFNDLYYTFYGFVVLKPEYTKQYDLGFTYLKAFENKLLSQFSIQGDAYYNRVKDKIAAVPANNLARWSMENLGLVEIRGLDVNVQSAWQLTTDLSLTAGLTYTYQEAIDAAPISPNYKNQIPYVPVHSGSFMSSATYKQFSVNYSFIYTGERYNQSANIMENYVMPWYTHDAAVHYNTRFNKREIRITAEINNLLNQDYAVIENFPMPGRNYRFGLTYNY
ncbi:TonB-dependent receptor [Pedobacter africanus]|uniref:Outer membrane cobalamin receptor protein n=1 Tax=Pedobacter africanus TaxID=151894 RepID=A0A1W2DEL2_9SPHI|nr:TonB-dependent receptor [Pedobacter africanus]SMC95694.1 Outer membrane cobalamin receptor protein [Pedobacter africanus]